ncbi:MAG: hypothetical protein ACPG45_01610 [Flavobacteriaceae bacterium]
MKNIVVLMFILLVSCQKDAPQISENSSLKNLPKVFFDQQIEHTIHAAKKNYTFINEFKRLPNTEFSKFYLKKHPDTYLPYFNVTINLNKDTKITLEGAEVLKSELIEYTKEFIDFAAEGQQAMIHLNFEEDVLLKDYIEFIYFIKPITSSKIILNSNVFIYNTKLLPDCDCTL